MWHELLPVTVSFLPYQVGDRDCYQPEAGGSVQVTALHNIKATTGHVIALAAAMHAAAAQSQAMWLQGIFTAAVHAVESVSISVVASSPVAGSR